MVTARSFATRNHYDVDVDREFIALGACNVAAGFSHGFAVTGADSRTAVSDAMGGKTQVTGLVAAAAIAILLLFFTGPLSYLPGSALGAVLISAGLGLFDCTPSAPSIASSGVPACASPPPLAWWRSAH